MLNHLEVAHVDVKDAADWDEVAHLRRDHCVDRRPEIVVVLLCVVVSKYVGDQPDHKARIKDAQNGQQGALLALEGP